MAVVTKIPTAITPTTAESWAIDNGAWLQDILTKHSAWIKASQIEKYQAAYDGDLEEIEARDKARGDETNYKLTANYAQLIIDTVVDYLLGKAPIFSVEDEKQEDNETNEAEIVTEYRKKLHALLKAEQAQRVLSEQLRQGSIACYSAVIAWVDENGQIDYEEYPAQEVIPIMDTRGRLKLVIRQYDVETITEGSDTQTRKRLEIYDDRYVTYLIGDETGAGFILDQDEVSTGNPIEHKAGRIPVSLFINGQAAKYETRIKRAGTSDLGNGVYDLIVAYANGLSDKANLVDYLQDQYLKLTGVDVDQGEVLKMRKARAIALKSKDADADFIAQSQEDKAVENYLNRLENGVYDTTFTPKLNKLEGATATEIKMKYAALDIKAGKKEIYFMGAILQLIEILTDLMNAEKLIANGVSSPYEVLRDKAQVAARDDLYKSEWVSVTLNRNLPQNYKEIADIVSVLSGKVPDGYLIELLWFIDDPVKALNELKKQKEDATKASMAAMGYTPEVVGDTGNDTNTDDGSGDATA